ncbi:hypothetical protein ABS71_13535 [bacterium SCN 62-11]|nr:DUF4037 domain-containing protein [Candidatus Eremiobacteraeota bacterium]ODT64133.1 MAG: hypothetical protein ABS71_13535 [bacterium SCN 62-11]
MKGLELSERFYHEAVRPLLSGVAHAAGRLGSGSDVLGLDDDVSRDHDWGCRLTLLVEAEQIKRVDELLEAELPADFLGFPVRFATTWDALVRHRAEVASVEGFSLSRLGHIPTSPIEWLLLPGQSLLEVTAGPVFHDAAGEFTALRERLAWYPQDVWLYTLASGWTQLCQELPLWHRAGGMVLQGRIQKHLIHLAFLLEKRWPAYSKWTERWLGLTEFGREFLKLDWEAALLALHARLRSLGLVTAPATEPFFDRGYITANSAVAEQLYAHIQDPEVAALPRGLGSIEQWCDNSSLAFDHRRRVAAAAVYGATLDNDC